LGAKTGSAPKNKKKNTPKESDRSYQGRRIKRIVMGLLRVLGGRRTRRISKTPKFNGPRFGARRFYTLGK